MHFLIRRKFLVTFIFILAPLVFLSLHYFSQKIDYSNLESLLKQKKWLEADQETSNLMHKILLEAVDSQYFFGYSRIDILGQERANTMTFPSRSCHSFHKIDKLWTTYSSDKYGFTKQAKIMQKILSRPNSKNSKYRNEFKNTVGWTSEWNFRNPQLSNQIDVIIKNEGSLPSPQWFLQTATKSIDITQFIEGYNCTNYSSH